MTPNPCSSTSQPMMSSVSGQVYSSAPVIRAQPRTSVRMTAAAAPSPNSASATMLALVSLSSLTASEHNSTATTRTLVPGCASARRAPIERPVTPPAHPKPNTGTRETSGRKFNAAAARVSKLGVAMPVEDTVTTQSTSAPDRPAFASARRDAKTSNRLASERYTSVRSGQDRSCSYHSPGRTAWRRAMPAFSNTGARRSNSGMRSPNMRRVRSATSSWVIMYSGTAVAIEHNRALDSGKAETPEGRPRERGDNAAPGM